MSDTYRSPTTVPAMPAEWLVALAARSAVRTTISGDKMLTKHCIRPGVWSVEGHIVRRYSRPTRWSIDALHMKKVVIVWTFKEACEWIQEEMAYERNR